MDVLKDIRTRSTSFEQLCKEHHVRTLYLFGSAVTDHFREEQSDIDLVVEVDDLDPIVKGEHLIQLWDDLELFFNRKVDLLTEASIMNPYLRKSIDATKVLIYDGRAEKVLD